jgi:hypothetical protein
VSGQQSFLHGILGVSYVSQQSKRTLKKVRQSD